MKAVTSVIALAAVLVGLAGCGGEAPEEEPAATSSASDEHDHAGGGPDGPTQPTIVDLGAPVSLSGEIEGETFEVTYAVTKVDTAKMDSKGDKPANDQVFVVAEVEVRSYRGSHAVGANNEDYVFALVDKKDKEYEQSKNVVGEALKGTVGEGDTATGSVTFDVPETVAEDGKIRLAAKGANGGDQTILWRQE